MSSVKPSPARVGYADWVRLLAAAMVVMIHCAAPIFNDPAISGADFVLATALDGISHAAVPLFVMVSGMFLLDESRPMTVRRAVTRYVLPLVGLYVFWSVAYALINKIAMPVLFEGAALDGALLGDFAVAAIEGAYHMWYLPMTAGLYLLCPLLRCFVSRDNRRPAEYFLLLVLVCGFVLPTGALLCDSVFDTTFSKTLYGFHLLQGLQYPAYFVAGWLIANFRPQPRRRVAVYAAGGVSLGMMVALTLWLSAGEPVADLMEPTGLFCAIYAVALFALFAWEGQNLRACGWLTRLSGLTFGVYIVHVEVQALFREFVPFTGGALGYIALQWVAVTAVSLVAAWVLSRIPLLKRTVRG